jgi:hypothetical protein
MSSKISPVAGAILSEGGKVIGMEVKAEWNDDTKQYPFDGSIELHHGLNEDGTQRPTELLAIRGVQASQLMGMLSAVAAQERKGQIPSHRCLFPRGHFKPRPVIVLLLAPSLVWKVILTANAEAGMACARLLPGITLGLLQAMSWQDKTKLVQQLLAWITGFKQDGDTHFQLVQQASTENDTEVFANL